MSSLVDITAKNYQSYLERILEIEDVSEFLAKRKILSIRKLKTLFSSLPFDQF